MLGLGEFETDGFESSNQTVMLWVWFVLATFLTQIIFINTLVAILANTYTKIMEQKQKYALKQRANIYSDYLHLIQPADSLWDAKFVYIVKPVQQPDEEEDEAFDEMTERHEEAVKY